MNLKITEQKDNPLLVRKEIKAQLSYEAATPSTKDLHAQLASGLKVKPELLVVKHIYPGFGTRQADVLVYQYESKEQLERVEGAKKKPAEKKEEAAPEKTEAKAEEKPAEKKAEDRKEEPEKKEGKAEARKEERA